LSLAGPHFSSHNDLSPFSCCDVILFVVSLPTTLPIFFTRLCRDCSCIEALWSLSHHCHCPSAELTLILLAPLRSSSSSRCRAHLHLHCCSVVLIFIFVPSRSSLSSRRRAHLHLHHCAVTIIIISAPSHSSSAVVLIFIVAPLRSSHHCAVERSIFIAPLSTQASLLCRHLLRFSVHCHAVEVARSVHCHAIKVARSRIAMMMILAIASAAAS
jgi:hypothetical protein